LPIVYTSAVQPSAFIHPPAKAVNKFTVNKFTMNNLTMNNLTVNDLTVNDPTVNNFSPV